MSKCEKCGHDDARVVACPGCGGTRIINSNVGDFAETPRPCPVCAQVEYPEGCTPTDIRVLRKANLDLAMESHELREALRELVRQISEFTEENGEADFYTGDAARLLKDHDIIVIEPGDTRTDDEIVEAIIADSAPGVGMQAAATVLLRELHTERRNIPARIAVAMRVLSDAITRDAGAPSPVARQDWTPVSERLPDDGVVVLVRVAATPIDNPSPWIGSGHYVRDEFADLMRWEVAGTFGWGSPVNVTHWMPLPEAPK